MKASYRTISEPSDGSFKDRGSRFLSFAYPVQHESEVKEILEQLRKEYHDARHHCYAYRIGIDPVLVRANDDGEPSSSAGKPILNQIEKYDLINTLVVVVRYFGGKLLGVGGLINAYRTATMSAIENSHIVRKKIKHLYRLTFEYPQMNDVMTIIKENQVKTYDQEFEVSCSMNISIELAREQFILSKLNSIDHCSFTRLADK